MKFHVRVLASALLALGAAIMPAQAQQSAKDVLQTLNFQKGSVTLADDLATIVQTDGFRFLNNADTQSFLTKVWNNPPGTGKDALGMLFPVDGNLDWAVVVSYDPSGHVSDEDAGKIDYNELMADMKKAVAEASAERVQAGRGSLELLGWAKPPHYDAKEKKMYWAKRLRFDGRPQETLNYEIRILGRRGVLDLNVVGEMESFPAIDARVGEVLSMVRFNQGNTYGEYVAGTDNAAAYGLAGLVAGGVLAKAGFFKGLLALLIASKKVVLLALFGGIAGAWSWLKSRLGRKSAVAESQPQPQTPPDA